MTEIAVMATITLKRGVRPSQINTSANQYKVFHRPDALPVQLTVSTH